MSSNTHNAKDYYSFRHPLAGLQSFVTITARKKMFELFLKLSTPTAQSKIIDIGVTPDESCAQSNYFEQHYLYKEQITAASIENAYWLEKKYPGLKFLKLKHNADNKFIDESTVQPIADNAFDILFCNAVLEHVGSRVQQKKFIEECLRISKKIFITTPDRCFPVESHTILPFLHWLPLRFFRKILKLLKQDFLADEQNLNLFTFAELKNLVSQMPQNNPLNIKYYRIRTLGWPSNIVATIVKA